MKKKEIIFITFLQLLDIFKKFQNHMNYIFNKIMYASPIQPHCLEMSSWVNTLNTQGTEHWKNMSAHHIG
jgi:hypothetical protein